MDADTRRLWHTAIHLTPCCARHGPGRRRASASPAGPSASTSAWILVVSPPLERPMQTASDRAAPVASAPLFPLRGTVPACWWTLIEEGRPIAGHRDRFDDAIPHPQLPPAHEKVAAGCVRAVALGNINTIPAGPFPVRSPADRLAVLAVCSEPVSGVEFPASRDFAGN